MTDRRRRERVGLHYAVRLSRPDQWISVKTQTDNLSSIGFFCTSDQPFWPGEQLNCEVVIPSKEIGYHSGDLVLHRRVKVVRVEIRGLEPGFGVACEFDDRIPMN
jgi:PilZ domain